MPMRVSMIACCLVAALCPESRAAGYVLSFELREYRGRMAHETVRPVFGARKVRVATIWDQLENMDCSTLAQVEVKASPHARYEQHVRLGRAKLEVTINTGDLVDGRESSTIKLRYRDDQRASEVEDSRYYGIVNRPFFLHSEIARLPHDQSEVTLLWIAILRKVEELGQQNGAANGAAPRR